MSKITRTLIIMSDKKGVNYELDLKKKKNK